MASGGIVTAAGVYQPGDSWLYRLDPRVKLWYATAGLLTLIVTPNLAALITVLALALGVLLAGGVAGYAFWRAGRGPVAEPPVVPAWLRGAVVVTALAATAATVKTAYEASFIAHKNPLLMRETVPPADSIPARPTFGPRPPE